MRGLQVTEGEKYSLWLLPPHGDVYDAFEALILRLSKRCSAPRFGPHVTLLGGLRGRGVAAGVRALASSLRPFHIALTGLRYMDEYYQCLFIKALETEELMAANLRAQEAFNVSGSFMPHLSLMYGRYPAETKREIISEIGEEFPKGFIVEGIRLYRTEGDPEDWLQVGEFPFAGGVA
jgi:2'-5' RNA ligase